MPHHHCVTPSSWSQGGAPHCHMSCPGDIFGDNAPSPIIAGLQAPCVSPVTRARPIFISRLSEGGAMLLRFKARQIISASLLVTFIPVWSLICLLMILRIARACHSYNPPSWISEWGWASPNTCPGPGWSHPGHNGLNEELNFQHHDPGRMFGGWDILVALELYFNSLTVMVISGCGPELIQTLYVSLRYLQHTSHALHLILLIETKNCPCYVYSKLAPAPLSSSS